MSKTTVLIVEDEAIVAADVALKLEQFGYEVVGTSAKGEEAVDMACSLMPSIVLMDIQLNGSMDGIEAAEAIRGRVDIPVIFLTAHSDTATLERAKITDPFGYILKPFENRELTKTIEIALYKHQSDRELREQREWLRVTLTSIGDAVITCNTGGLVTFLNPVAEALTGWRIEEARNQPIREVLRLINEQTHLMTEDPVSLVLSKGRPIAPVNHTALVTRYFQEMPIEHSAAPIHSADGKIIGVVFVFRDVTEKRRAQDALRESEARLQTANENLQLLNEELLSANEELQAQREELQLMNEEQVTLNAELQERVEELNHANSDMENLLTSSDIAAMFLDRQLTIKRFTPAMARLLNLVPAYINCPAWHLASVKQCLDLSADSALALHNAVPLEREVTGIENGSCHLMRVLPYRTSDGGVDGFVVTLVDISALKKTEETLRKLSVAIEQSPTAIVITDAWGQIEFVNPRFFQITGYSAEEVIGSTPRILKGQTDDEVYRELWSTISAGKVWEGTFYNRKKDGAYFWERDIISPIRDKSGEITHYLAIKEDITERRSLKEQLLQAQKMEALGQLAGGVAHDFNNMLQVILGYASILNNDARSDQKEKISEILKATERASSLTNGLLAYSRKQVFKIESTDLNSLLKEVQKFLSRILGEDIALVIEYSPTPLVAAVDRAHMQQVFVNLASNSRDAMSFGGKLIICLEKAEIDDMFVRSYGFGAAGPHALITVSDTGKGIFPEHLHKIFEPFFTTKGESKGTGLGLSIVYGIVKQLNGFITCESVKEQGATFRIYLPLVAESQATEETVPEYQVPEAYGVTIMIVEDESVVRKLIRTILERHGFATIEADSGRQAIDIFNTEHEKIDLVLLDAIMPEFNGAETLAGLRVIKPGQKALFISGYAREIITGKMFLPDDVELISKPVRPECLIESIRKAI